MNDAAVLHAVLARVGAGVGAAVFSASELGGWPPTAVGVMKACALLAPAMPAANAVCPGCEQQCLMPVHVVRRPNGASAMFAVCDKRSDVNRVTVAPGDLELWQSNSEAIAVLLAALLNLRRSHGHSNDAGQWNVGVLRGKQHSAHLTLIADGELKLDVAGHTISLADVLEFDTGKLTVDKRTLIRLVDQPRAGGGNSESAGQRQQRLVKRIAEVQAKGTKAFLKVVASEEDISVQRLKQILGRPSPTTSSESGKEPKTTS